MSTIHDVARAAGVGVGTVSRHLNGAVVRPATAAAIEAAIRELRFVANRAARGLARGRLPAIAVLIPYVTQPSAFERVRGILDAARDDDPPVSLYDVAGPAQLDAHIRALSSDLRPEGLIVVSLALSATQLATLEASDVHPVFLDAHQEGRPSLIVDDVDGGRLATAHLIDLGHTRIAFIGDWEDSALRFRSSARRHRGYLEAMAEAGLVVPAGYESLGDHGAGPAFDHALALLSRADRPTAIFAASDTQALGVLRAARESGVQVPDECSIIGFDDVESARSAGLTTVRQPLAEMSARAVELLRSERAAAPSSRLAEVFPVQVVQRSTTCRMARSSSGSAVGPA